MIRGATTLILLLLTAQAGPEMVEVRDRGAVSLATFECRDINRSSIIQRVCYDRAQRILIVSFSGVYDQYCGLPASIFDELMGAPSMGQFFNRKIRVSADFHHCPK
jgi:hypothetical protein